MDLRVAAYAIIIDEDGRMLLAHWSQQMHAAWTLPGGGLEPGERPEHAAQREVLEETGYRAKVEDLLGVDSRVIPPSRRLNADATVALHTLRIIYRARVVGGSLRNEVDGTTDKAQWFTQDEIAKLKRVHLVDIGRKMAGFDPIE